MCGIVAIVSTAPVAERLLSGLRQLEYRGYDSSGIATIHEHAIYRLRSEGKLINLEAKIRASAPPGTTGIGHTRWATHGLPTEENAHPHATKNVALVHNGIIENFRELKEKLEQAGVTFSSQTDTEVILHLIDHELRQGKNPKDAVLHSLSRLQGAFALGIIFAAYPNLLIVARKGSPLAVGYAEGEMYAGSDAIALSPFTAKISYLEEGDIVVLTPHSATFYNAQGTQVKRPIRTTPLSGVIVSKGEFPHFMLKEIYEQPTVVGETISAFCNFSTGDIQLPPLPFDVSAINNLTLVACGTAYYAALVARYWFEELAHITVQVDVASEYRYRFVSATANSLAFFISQSGETADTLAAMRVSKNAGQHCIAITNTPESTLAHETGITIPTYAGREIGVAATKTFTAQLATLACIAIALGGKRNIINAEERAQMIHALAEIPSRMVEALHHEESIIKAAALIAKAHDVLYIGRGRSHALALEGALKLKEISYIHAEGYPAGELKHGPIALIDENVPVIALAPSDALFEKTASNIQEVAARGGKVILISDAKGCSTLKNLASITIEMPQTDAFSAPLLYAVPIQLLAYHVAVLKGTDVDQPRNLAKSVTVE